jgi:hypothetical protein
MPTLTNAQLHALIKPILPFASKDTTLPILTAIHFAPLGDKLTAYATDRYRVGRMRLPQVDAEGFQATIPVATVKWLLTVFKVKDKENRVTLAMKDDETVSVTGSTQWGPAISAEISLALGEYPKIYGLFPEDIGKYEHAASAAMNGQFLADMGAVAGNGYGVPPIEIRMTGQNQNKAVLFSHNVEDYAEFAGLLMPVRMPSASDK